jgi:hypothetical protein
MKPIKFKEANAEFAKDQPEYNNLPALLMDGDDGYVVACWKANIFERVQILFSGRVWFSVMTFKKPLQPSYMSAFRQGVYSRPKDWSIWSRFLQNVLTKK